MNSDYQRNFFSIKFNINYCFFTFLTENFNFATFYETQLSFIYFLTGHSKIIIKTDAATVRSSQVLIDSRSIITAII